MLNRISAAWARIELLAAALLAGAITVLILINVITRNLGASIYWIDELAIYAMIWMSFLGASAALHYGHAVSVTILTDALPRVMNRIAAKLVDILIFVFAILMIWFCWRWFMPLELISNGLIVDDFQGATFNFVYSEPTTTLGIRKFWVWSVMCLFAFGATLHSLSTLLGSNPNAAENAK